MKRDNSDGSSTYYGPQTYVTIRDGMTPGAMKRRRNQDLIDVVSRLVALVLVLTFPIWIRWYCLIIVWLAGQL
jgi:hypothetical protein